MADSHQLLLPDRCNIMIQIAPCWRVCCLRVVVGQQLLLFFICGERRWKEVYYCSLGLYTEDRYFLVPVPNWVGTRVLLRFWTNGTVIGAFFFFFYFFFFFGWFFTGFWHGWFLNVYQTVMTTNLTTNLQQTYRDLTLQKRNQPGC